jgi:hypothetical protein
MELIATTFRIPFEQSRLYLCRRPREPALPVLKAGGNYHGDG